MKYINKIGMMTVAAGMLAIASCSDFSDYNTAPDYAGQSGKTIWENISSDAELSDFVQAVQKAGYAEELQKSHYYTVWAPVNGSFNKDSLMALSSDKILQGFVKNHISEYNHAETDENDSIIFMLNEKLYHFQNENGLQFGGKSVIVNSETSFYNHPCSNGLYYKIKSPAIWRPSGYEYLDEVTGIAEKYSAYVKAYETQTIDESKSVKGAIINNEQTYDDSVMVINNTFFHGRIGRAYVDVEDSSYSMLIPNDEAWTDAYSNYESLYNYIDPMNWMDLSLAGTTKGSALKPGDANKSFELSLPDGVDVTDKAAYWKDSLASTRIVRNTVFNNNNRYNFKLDPSNKEYRNYKGETLDTLYSTAGSYITGMNLSNLTPTQLSNGWAYIRNNVKLTNWFSIYSTNIARVVSAKNATYTRMSYPKSRLPKQIQEQLDSVTTTLSYYKIENATNTGVPEVDFYCGNPVSTTYRMFVVMVPNWLEDWIAASTDSLKEAAIATAKPYSLRFDFTYTGADGNLVNVQKMGGNTYLTDATKLKLDTLDLGSVTFPVSYSGLSAYPNLRIMHTITTFTKANRDKYAQVLRVAKVILLSEDYYKHLYPEANANKEEE